MADHTRFLAKSLNVSTRKDFMIKTAPPQRGPWTIGHPFRVETA